MSKSTLKDLIRALQIFLKYGNPMYPTHCEHDVLCITDFDPDIITAEDKAELDELGFFVSDEYECFISFRFGSS